jgi:stringent starvation protein B
MSQEKREKLLEMLDSGPRGLVALHVLPDVEGVELPSHLMVMDKVCLNVAYGFNLSEFRIDEHGVIATLSFSRRPFRCVIPWESVWAILSPEENNLGYMWTPHEGKMLLVGPNTKEDKEEEPPPQRGGLRLIKGGKS